MKKLFTIDDIMAAFVSAMGYGFTMTISKIFGWPKLVCYAACFVVGILSEQIVNRVIFSETVQKNRRNRILAFAGCFLVFIAAHVISLVLLETSLFDYLGEQFVSVIGLPILGFFVNLVIRWFRVRKIRGLYGDGSRVHMMYWDEKPLLENLGSGTVDAAAALLGNDDALQMYGSVMTEDLSETLGALLAKFVKGDALELYPNEIRRVDAVEWKTFPKALVVSDGELRCDRIEDSIQERMGREWMPGGKNDGMGS